MIKLTHLNKRYGSRLVLQDLNLVFPNKGFVAITGENGCGKTTLLRILGLLDDRYEGQLEIDGVSLEKAKEKVLSNYRRSLFAYGFQEGNYLDGFSNKANLLLWSELTGNAHPVVPSNVAGLSQGEKTLLALTFALSSKKKIILLDEITSSLSIERSQEIIGKIKEVAASSLVVFITHDPLVLSAADYHLRLGGGGILSSDLPSEGGVVAPSPISQSKPLSTRHLLGQVLRTRGFSFGFLLVLFAALFSFPLSSLSLGFYDAEGDYANHLETNDVVWLSSNDSWSIVDLENHANISLNVPSVMSKEKMEALRDSGLDYWYEQERGTDSLSYSYSAEDYVCRIPQNSLFDLQKNGSIEGNLLHLVAQNDDFWVPYETVDYETNYRFQVNLNQTNQFVFKGAIHVPGSMWDNPKVELSALEGKKEALGVLGDNEFVSPSRLRSPIALAVPDDVIYLPDSLKEYSCEGVTHFLSPTQIDYGASWSYFRDLSALFPLGVKTLYRPEISSYLSGREILVSESVYSAACLSSDFSGRCYAKIHNAQTDYQAILKSGVSPSLMPSQNKNEVQLSTIKGLESIIAQRSYYRPAFYTFGLFHVLMALVLVGVSLRVYRNKDKRNNRLLRSLGYSSFQSYLGLISPIAFGALGGAIVGFLASCAYLANISRFAASFYWGSCVMALAFLSAIVAFLYFDIRKRKRKD